MTNYKDAKYQFPTSAITSGTFADARIASSNVTQHSTSFDDNKLVNDVSTLAIRQASDASRTSYNTNSQFVDVFTDATGLDNLTTTGRNSVNAWVGTAIYGQGEFLYDSPNFTPSRYQYYHTGYSSNNSTWTDIPDAGMAGLSPAYTRSLGTGTGNHHCCATSTGTTFPSTDVGNYVIVDFKENKDFNSLAPDYWQFGKQNGYGDMRQCKAQYSTDNITYTNFDFSNAVQEDLYHSKDAGQAATAGSISFPNGGSDGIFVLSQHVNHYFSSIVSVSGIPGFTARYIKIINMARYSGTANSNAGIQLGMSGQFETAFNAAGSFTCNNIATSETISKMGGIITYKDQAGTGGLNSDIILKLSANGGTNWTTATLTAAHDYASGIKMAKVNDLTIANTGSSLKYKIELANQVSGSKEQRIQGVALQY